MMAGSLFRFRALVIVAGVLVLAACSTPAPRQAVAEAPPTALPTTDASASSAGSDVAIAAMNFLDHPYQIGGQSVETGFDCSGFTRHVIGQTLGVELPRSALEQARAPSLRPVARDALQAGDLVFFNTQQRAFSHVGIYVGDGRFIHAPRTGAQIRTERMGAAYWSRRYDGARRVAAIDTANP